MTLTLLPFNDLRCNTRNLNINYSTLLGRYKVVEEQTTGPQQTSLDTLIARTNEVIKSKSDREGQIEVFNLLVNELRQIPKGDKEKTEQGSKFLLGALIHRYFRLVKSYEGFNGYACWTYFGTREPTNSRLFLAIRKALRLKDIEAGKKRFLEDDLKILDAVTVAQALEVFRDNMLVEDSDRVPRFMKYPHLRSDDNFKQYLQQIIDEQSKRAKPFLNRYKAISFIQSLSNQIEDERQQLEKAIEKWCKAVAKDYKDFNVFKTLDEKEIIASLEKYVESEKSKSIIHSLFYTPQIQENLETINHLNFSNKMKECSDFTCSWILFGGYVLLQKQSKTLDADLAFVLEKALSQSFDKLTAEDKLDGVNFLKEFFETAPDVALDYEFFGTKDKMNTAIARAEKELAFQTTPRTEDMGFAFA